MNQKYGLLEGLKWLCVVLLVVFLLTQLLPGGSSNTAFSVMVQAVSGPADMENMQPADEQMVRRLYGLDPQDFGGILLYYPVTNMQAQELLLVKLTDTAQQQTVTDAVQRRLETQKNSFDGYGAEQFAMLEKAVLEIRGGYVLLVVAEDTQPVVQAFLDAL